MGPQLVADAREQRVQIIAVDGVTSLVCEELLVEGHVVGLGDLLLGGEGLVCTTAGSSGYRRITKECSGLAVSIASRVMTPMPTLGRRPATDSVELG
jgi:hypothetical protein